MEKLKPVKYSNVIGADFNSTLNKRVRAYFKENNISKYANTNMKIKTVFMTCLFVIPTIFLCSGLVQSVWLTGLLYLAMGLGTAGVGLAIMHDANHSAYSKKENVNRWVGKLLNLVGGFAPTWKIQHNILHHTYTNVEGYDEDIDPPPFLRFSPNAELKPIHKYQHYFAWFFYGLMTFSWIVDKDFKQLSRYKAMDLTRTENESYGKLLAELIAFKIFYYIIALIIPIVMINISWWWFPIFFFMLHFVAGSILAYVFQPAHVVPETKFVVAEKDLTIPNNFAIHQMETTANYAPKSTILYWLVGGLNYQVEHHLFPSICHVHYKALSKIVKQTAEEYNVPYNTHPTFFKAIKYHMQMLKALGRGEEKTYVPEG